jgi:hypothetical protein
VDQVYS